MLTAGTPGRLPIATLSHMPTMLDRVEIPLCGASCWGWFHKAICCVIYATGSRFFVCGVCLGDLYGITNHLDPPLMKPHRTITRSMDLRHGVCGHHDHASITSGFAQPLQAFLFELIVADRQRLVDEQDSGTKRSRAEAPPERGNIVRYYERPRASG